MATFIQYTGERGCPFQMKLVSTGHEVVYGAVLDALTQICGKEAVTQAQAKPKTWFQVKV